MKKLEPIAVLWLRRENCVSPIVGSSQMASESCLPSIRMLRENRLRRNRKYERCAIDVRDFNTLVSKVKISKLVVMFMTARLEEVVVVTTFGVVKEDS